MKKEEIDYINLRRYATRTLWKTMNGYAPMPEEYKEEYDLKYE